MLEFDVKLRIKRENGELSSSFGPGTAELLRGVREYSSLNKSAKAMRMAYSKAWKSINQTEDQLGFALIERIKSHGSHLTEKGEQLLKMYDEMVDAAHTAIEKVSEQTEFDL